MTQKCAFSHTLGPILFVVGSYALLRTENYSVTHGIQYVVHTSAFAEEGERLRKEKDIVPDHVLT